MKQLILSKPELATILEGLIKTKAVFAPVAQDNLANFRQIASTAEIVWGPPQTVIPPKKLLFPSSEELIAYEFSGSEVRAEALNRIEQRIIFGLHPCDLNGIFQLDQVFAEKNHDENYLEKRQSTILIGVDCLKPCAPESTCYRLDGLNPKGRFDLFLIDLGNAFFVQVATTKGEALLKGAGQPAGRTESKRLKAVHNKRDLLFDKKQPKLQPKLKSLPNLLSENYQHPEWEARGNKCYGCGSCNMVCPTCYCFDVQDYLHIGLSRGVRTRAWDGCMLEDFARVATGENFREDRGERLRHRTNRKLNYLFTKWGESFCTGCGRCPKACLTKIVSPLEIANALFA